MQRRENETDSVLKFKAGGGVPYLGPSKYSCVHFIGRSEVEQIWKPVECTGLVSAKWCFPKGIPDRQWQQHVAHGNVSPKLVLQPHPTPNESELRGWDQQPVFEEPPGGLCPNTGSERCSSYMGLTMTPGSLLI